MNNTDILVIGAGPAGLNAAESAAKNGGSVLLAGAEKYLPYWRPRLSKMLSKLSSPDEIAIKPQQWFDKNKITVKTGAAAARIDVSGKQVLFADESSIGYNKLILAMGSHSFIPPIKGSNNTLALRSYDDAAAIRKAALEAGRAVVFGGGLLGLETAFNLMEAGIPVTVVERSKWLLNRQLPEQGGEFLADFLKSCGIGLITGADTDAQEELIKGACVVAAAGVRPNLDLVKDTGIETGRAIIVGSRMETSIQDIYACGDVAEFNGKCPGLLPVAAEQGKIAGTNASGGNAEYTEISPSPLLKVGELSVFSAGDNANGTVYAIRDEKTFKSVCLKDGVLTGGVLIGDISIMNKLKNAVAQKKAFENAASADDVLSSL